MEYVYAAMLIHKLGKPIDEATVRKVIESAGGHADDGRVKALCAAMKGLDIDKAIKEAAMPVAVAAAPADNGAKKEEKKPEEEKKSAEAAAAGLGALFG